MIKFLLHLFLISFLLNFTWEISQMGFYGPLGMGSLDNYNNFVKIHWEVSLKDALMVVVVYLLIGFLLRNWQWAKPSAIADGRPTLDSSSRIGFRAKSWNGGWAILWISLPFWQAVIEYYSVYMVGRWAYAESMPLILGIGALPILQMLILPSVAIFLSRYLLSSNHNNS